MSSKDIEKPNIEDVYAAFQEYQNLTYRIASDIRRSRYSEDSTELMKKARQHFKDKLKAMGLAQYIDWSEN